MVTNYKILGNSLRILVPERRLLPRNSHVELGKEGEINTYWVKPLRVLKWFTTRICLLRLNQRALKMGKWSRHGRLQEMAEFKAWKYAQRKLSIISQFPLSWITGTCWFAKVTLWPSFLCSFSFCQGCSEWPLLLFKKCISVLQPHLKTNDQTDWNHSCGCFFFL